MLGVFTVLSGSPYHIHPATLAFAPVNPDLNSGNLVIGCLLRFLIVVCINIIVWLVLILKIDIIAI